MHQVELNPGTSKSSKEKSFFTFKDIDLRECHEKLYKKQVKLWEQIEFKNQKSVSTVFLTDFRCILHSFRVQKCKVNLLGYKTSLYRKLLYGELLKERPPVAW